MYTPRRCYVLFDGNNNTNNNNDNNGTNNNNNKLKAIRRKIRKASLPECLNRGDNSFLS